MHLLLKADARRIPIADGSVQCVVTSPPYFGLRDYGTDGQIGLEPSPAEYVRSIVSVFREVQRVLRDDGVAWLNLGDSYCQDTKWGGSSSNKNEPKVGYPRASERRHSGLKSKDRMGIPHRVVFALQDDGWYWRDEIIWYKRNPMPESVEDRTTKAHEMVFLLTKRPTYYYDQEAIKEAASGRDPGNKETHKYEDISHFHAGLSAVGPVENRNARSVWDIPLVSFKGSHFATMPPKLAERCIRAGTSEKGCCPTCGSPWKRLTESERVATRPGEASKVAAMRDKLPAEEPGRSRGPERFKASTLGSLVGNRDPQRHTTTTRTTGWQASCPCEAGDPIPCLVVDPFNGAGTSGSVATGLGRRYIGTDLNDDYLAMSERRISRPHARIAPAREPEAMPLFS